MRFLLGLVAALALLYGGYWLVGQRSVERGAAAAIAQMQAGGWEVSHEGIATGGFPSRFDTTISGLRVLDPASGVGWEAPWLRFVALSYQPNEVIALFPQEQSVILPAERIEIRSEGLRGSGKVGLSAAMAFDSVTLESGPLSAQSRAGWTVDLARALFALRRSETGTADYDLWFEGTDLGIATARLGALPEAVAAVRIDGTVTLDQPITRVMGREARLTALNLRQATVDFGATGFVAEGGLTFDAAGVPTGTVNLTIRDWRAALAVAGAAGILPGPMAGIAGSAGALLARGSTDLTAPLILEGGQMRLGPVPLGPAPALYAGR